ncbi:MAG: helix-turn-helix domain-containing protein [Firmicutes bacterium]|nr:helix-turn-helix domain-containing protein [Bacillota bacterium]
MDNAKIGELIKKLRDEQNLTQQQLADKLNISNKTVSKWENGLGCPDVSLLPQLSAIFGVDTADLLAGRLNTQNVLCGNLQKLQFYICPNCGNLLMAMGEAKINCCGKTLTAAPLQKAPTAEQLTVELLEDELLITSSHEMTKQHYIAFIALLSADTLQLRKLYPEWELQTRLPRMPRGQLLWYCTRHGLFYQNFYYKKLPQHNGK